MLAKLETSSYYQGKRSIDEYVDEFWELVDQARYKEGLAIVVKFCRSLNRDLQDQIAQLLIRCPNDDDPDEWYSAAIRAEENHMANHLFHGGIRVVIGTQSPGPSPQMYKPRILPWASQPIPPQQAMVPNLAPMDIDATQKKREVLDVCQRCGKLGHWAQDCPLQFDICYMTVKKRQEWVQTELLEADVQDAHDKEETKEAKGEDEDFQDSSR